MKREVLLFAEEFISDNQPLFNSAQGQVFIGRNTNDGERRVIKQINLQQNPKALLKELQVFKLFVERISEHSNQQPSNLLPQQDKLPPVAGNSDLNNPGSYNHDSIVDQSNPKPQPKQDISPQVSLKDSSKDEVIFEDNPKANKYNSNSNPEFSFIKETLDYPDLFKTIKGVPKILGLKYTENIAELMLEHSGESVQSFISKPQWQETPPFKKACIAFDLLRQLILPLYVLHKAQFTHGDIKPDNICVRKRPKPVPIMPASEILEQYSKNLKGDASANSKPSNSSNDQSKKNEIPCYRQLKSEQPLPYESEYEFTLIDFGIISKFKIQKALRNYSSHIGNMMYSSYRALQLQQTRYQDDIEALMYIVFVMVAGRLPWDVEFRERVKDFYGDKQKTLKLFSELRLQMHEKFTDFICFQFMHLVPPKLSGIDPVTYIPKHEQNINERSDQQISSGKRRAQLEDKINPFRKLFHILNLCNLQQENLISKYHKLRKSLKTLKAQDDPDFGKIVSVKDKIEKLQNCFQLDYENFLKLAEWPNHYVKGYDKVPASCISKKRSTKYSSEGSSPIIQPQKQMMHFKSANQKLVGGMKDQRQQSNSFGSLRDDTEDKLEDQIKNLKAMIGINQVKQNQSHSQMNSARNHIPQFSSQNQKLKGGQKKLDMMGGAQRASSKPQNKGIIMDFRSLNERPNNHFSSNRNIKQSSNPRKIFKSSKNSNLSANSSNDSSSSPESNSNQDLNQNRGNNRLSDQKQNLLAAECKNMSISSVPFRPQSKALQIQVKEFQKQSLLKQEKRKLQQMKNESSSNLGAGGRREAQQQRKPILPDRISDGSSSEEEEKKEEEAPPQILASELQVNEEEKEEFDLDLTRFNTSENTQINTHYFEKLAYTTKVNCLKEISDRNKFSQAFRGIAHLYSGNYISIKRPSNK